LAAGLALGATTFATSAPVQAQASYDGRVATPAPLVVLRAGPQRGRTFVPPEPLPGPRRAATFNVTYTGFNKAQKAAFQRAVNIWARLLNSSVTITVRARYRDLGDPNILGSAGPSFFWHDTKDIPRARTYYVDAIANRHARRQLDPAPDINANFNSTFPNWHFGKGPAPAGDFDFTSVVLHELGHGLGLVGLGVVSGGAGIVQFVDGPGDNQPKPSIYSRFVETNKGKSILSFPNQSGQLANVLQSNKLFYDSSRVRNANNNKPAKIFAPTPFQPGSSYSHLDENAFPNGNRNSLMTPFLSPGETIRDPGPITKAIFKDSGW
jgi:hypothetical protein